MHIKNGDSYCHHSPQRPHPNLSLGFSMINFTHPSRGTSTILFPWSKRSSIPTGCSTQAIRLVLLHSTVHTNAATQLLKTSLHLEIQSPFGSASVTRQLSSTPSIRHSCLAKAVCCQMHDSNMFSPPFASHVLRKPTFTRVPSEFIQLSPQGATGNRRLRRFTRRWVLSEFNFT